jgi:hypothetical protein
MTLDLDSSGVPASGQPEHERPTDPRPAWERIAYAWLAREVDGGQPVDPTTLAREVSVAPGFARDLLRVLRTHRQHAPALSELRVRLVRDQITDAYLARELPGGQRLDPKELAAEVGTTTTVARQWLHTLRAGHQTDPRLGTCGPSRSATATQPASSWPRCRPPTPTAADPNPTSVRRRDWHWSGSSSSTRPARSPKVNRSTRPRSPSRLG